MKRRKAAITTVLLGALLFPVQLVAAVHTYNATVDLSSSLTITHHTGQWSYSWALAGAPTFNIQPGDTVQGTIAFARNESVQFTGPMTSAHMRLSMGGFITFKPTEIRSTTTLNGVTGSFTWPTPSTAVSTSPWGGEMHIGYATTTTQTKAAFSGFSFSALIVAGSGNYTPNVFFAHAGTDAADSISVIPEPSVAGLWGVGLISLISRARLNGVQRR